MDRYDHSSVLSSSTSAFTTSLNDCSLTVASTGNSSVKLLPSPGTLVTSIDPPCASTICCTTAMEWKIIRYFVEHEGRVVTREMLLDDVWGYEAFPTTRTVDNFILGLRKKIEKDPSQPTHLLTVHGTGYRFVKEEQEL